MSATEVQTQSKKKRKRSRGRKKAAAVVVAKTSSKAENALCYLKNWCKRQESGWKFNKANQVFLLRHGLAMEMSEDEFSLFCDYMKGLADGAKSALSRQAQQMLDDDSTADQLQDRARLLVQCLDTDVPISRKEDSDESDSD